jgi:glycine/D-amino acid oxidase-like deaminating enzyme
MWANTNEKLNSEKFEEVVMPIEERAVDWDCLIVGGGPAGLTAAIYLGRYRRNVVLIDGNNSRASLIPKSHNYPGFASGISGPDLLEVLRNQALAYGTAVNRGLVRSIAIHPGVLDAETTLGTISARRVILATGLVDNAPGIPRVREAIDEGHLRYCPICDGYEATLCYRQCRERVGQGLVHEDILPRRHTSLSGSHALRRRRHQIGECGSTCTEYIRRGHQKGE